MMNLQSIDTLGLGSVSGEAVRPTLARVTRSYLVQPVLPIGVASNADEFDAAARRASHFSEVADVALAVPNGSATLVEILVAIASSAAAEAKRLHATWRRSRDAHATYLTLRSLDERTLKDVGLHRSELRSAAAKLASEVDRSRTQAGRPLHALL